MQRHLFVLFVGSILLWSGAAYAYVLEVYQIDRGLMSFALILLFTFIVEYCVTRWVFNKPKHALAISIAALVLSSLFAAVLLPFSGSVVIAIGVPKLILFVVLLSCSFMVVVKLIVYHIIFKLPTSNIAFGATFVTSLIATSLWHYLLPFFR